MRPLAIVGRTIVARGMPLIVAFYDTSRPSGQRVALVMTARHGPREVVTVSTFSRSLAHFILPTHDLPEMEWDLAVNTINHEFPIEQSVLVVSPNDYRAWFKERAEPLVQPDHYLNGLEAYAAVLEQLTRRLVEMSVVYPLRNVGEFGSEGNFRVILDAYGDVLTPGIEYPVSKDQLMWLTDIIADELLYLTAGGVIPKSLALRAAHGRLSIEARGRADYQVFGALSRYVASHALSGPRLANIAGDLPNFEGSLKASYPELVMSTACGQSIASTATAAENDYSDIFVDIEAIRASYRLRELE